MQPPSPLALIRTRLARGNTLWALLLLLLCAQVADSHHLAEHALGGQDASLCDSLHSPATALSTPASLCPPEPQVASTLGVYQPPFISATRNSLAVIRAPPTPAIQS